MSWTEVRHVSLMATQQTRIVGVENGELDGSLNVVETENENMDYVNKTNIVFISVFMDDLINEVDKM